MGRVDVDGGQTGIANEGRPDPFGECLGGDAFKFLHDLGDLNFADIAFFGGFGEGEDLLNNGAGAGSAVLNDIDIAIKGRVVGLTMEQLGGHTDGGEEIVKIVGDGAGHLGDALKAVGIHEKEFEAASIFQFIGSEGFLGGNGGVLRGFGAAEADYFEGKIGFMVSFGDGDMEDEIKGFAIFVEVKADVAIGRILEFKKDLFFEGSGFFLGEEIVPTGQCIIVFICSAEEATIGVVAIELIPVTLAGIPFPCTIGEIKDAGVVVRMHR